MATNQNSPVVWLSDGPRLVLADGSVVALSVIDDDGDELNFVAGDQGRAVFGEAVDDVHTAIAYVDDPEAEEHDAVQEVLDEYGF